VLVSPSLACPAGSKLRMSRTTVMSDSRVIPTSFNNRPSISDLTVPDSAFPLNRLCHVPTHLVRYSLLPCAVVRYG
jgi:hypothetical protein